MKKFFKSLFRLIILAAIVFAFGVAVERYGFSNIMRSTEARLEHLNDIYEDSAVSGVVNSFLSSAAKSTINLVKKTAGVAASASSSNTTGLTGAPQDDDYENVSIDTELYPYYSYLTSSEKIIYQQVYSAINSFSASFEPEVNVNSSEIYNAVEAVFNDHPEFFWMDTGFTYQYLADGTCISVSLSYLFTADELPAAQARFNSAANAIISGASGLSGDYEKEVYVHDAIIGQTKYDEDAEMNQSAYSALVNGSSVCAGYSRAFQYIMLQLNIPTYYCSGYSSGDHAWNIVQLDDGYYNVDLTWDDVAGGTHLYFNGTDEDFSNSHTRTGTSVYLPACTAKDYRVFSAGSGVIGFFDSFSFGKPEAEAGTDISTYGVFVPPESDEPEYRTSTSAQPSSDVSEPEEPDDDYNIDDTGPVAITPGSGNSSQPTAPAENPNVTYGGGDERPIVIVR